MTDTPTTEGCIAALRDVARQMRELGCPADTVRAAMLRAAWNEAVDAGGVALALAELSKFTAEVKAKLALASGIGQAGTA